MVPTLEESWTQSHILIGVWMTRTEASHAMRSQGANPPSSAQVTLGTCQVSAAVPALEQAKSYHPPRFLVPIKSTAACISREGSLHANYRRVQKIIPFPFGFGSESAAARASDKVRSA